MQPTGSARHLDRAGLLGRLREAVERPVTVVAAQAGSGKTTLLRALSDGAGDTTLTAWVTVTSDLRDPAAFWTAVGDALTSHLPDGDGERPAATTSDGLTALLGRLSAGLAVLGERVVLVIDDVHLITGPELRSQVATFLQLLPDGLHVVLVGRGNLELGLHRRRLAGELTELRNLDLQLSLDEARALATVRDVGLSEPALTRLHERAEGWLTGLVLATDQLIGHPDPEAFVADFSGAERTVADYLRAEVLGQLAPDVRRLLLRASILEKVNGELADLLGEGSGSEGILQELGRGDGFVVPLDPHGTWFRLHHLYADLLAAQLRREAPDELARLHLAAAHWWADHDRPHAAIRHARAGGEQVLAASWLIRFHHALANDGHLERARALLGAYGVEFMTNPPQVAAVLASHELHTGTLEQAQAQLDLATLGTHLVAAEERHGFDAALLLVRLALARRRVDLPGVRALAETVHTFPQPTVSSHIAVDNDLRIVALIDLGVTEHWADSAGRGREHLARARELARRHDRPYREVAALAHLALAESAWSFARARELSREALALAEPRGWTDDRVVGPALVTLGLSLVQAGRLEDGAPWLAAAATMLDEEREPAASHLLQIALGALHLARGDLREAESAFRRAGRLEGELRHPSPLRAQQRSGLLWAMALAGEDAQVRAVLAAASAGERDSGELREIAAYLALTSGDLAGAVEEVAPTIAGAVAVHDPVVLVRSLLLQASARDAQGRVAEAASALELALDAAEPDTLILPFLFLASRPLLERHKTQHGAFVTEILDGFSGAPHPAPHPQVPSSDALSAAELRLLRYLPTNLTASAIGAELFVTTNTVKTHMRHIYAKLGAHTRDEAVDLARGLGLVGPSARRG